MSLSPGTFQTTVSSQQAPAVAGDPASVNPRSSVLAGQNGNAVGFKAGVAGATIGLFGWCDITRMFVSNSAQPGNSGAPNGFIMRNQDALITAYLTEAGMTIPAGFPVGNFMDGGDYWVLNAGLTEAVPGNKAYANVATGAANFAATGAPSTSSATGTIDPETLSVTASIANDVMTVTAVGSGLVVPGATLSGSGVATGTMVTAQLTGTAQGVGTYRLSIPEQTVASETITGTYGLFTALSALSGTFQVGDVLSGTGGGGVTAGTLIVGLGTGTGGLGTYYVTPTQTVTSTTIDATNNVETGWYCRSYGAPGELVKISSQAMG